VTSPAVLAVMLGVVMLSGPMAPEPESKEIEVEPVMIPEPLIVPAPVAVMVSTVPETLAPMVIGASVPVFTKLKVPLAVIELLREMPPEAESVRLKLPPVDAPLPVMAWESVRVTSPDVLAVMFGVEMLSGPMAPVLERKAIDVVPVTLPEPEIEPAPVAVMVSTVPETLAPTVIGASVPVFTKLRVPLAVIELLREMPPEAESVRLKLPPVDTPLPVMA
jgi:hypothetical protein